MLLDKISYTWSAYSGFTKWVFLPTLRNIAPKVRVHYSKLAIVEEPYKIVCNHGHKFNCMMQKLVPRDVV
jgi:hypothetical protein